VAASTATEPAAALFNTAALSQKSLLYLASGGGLVAAGGGLLVAGLTKRGQIEDGDFDNMEQLDDMAASANTLGAIGMASAALGAGLLGVGLVTTGTTTAVVLGGRF
jgi:hypothetical protein